jgi:hypothetical protein
VQLLDYETTPRKVPCMCARSPQNIASGLSIGASAEAFTTAEDQFNNTAADDTTIAAYSQDGNPFNPLTTPGLEGYKAPCADGKHCNSGNWLVYLASFLEGTKNTIHYCIECSLGMHVNCNVICQSCDIDTNNLNLLRLKCKEKENNNP